MVEVELTWKRAIAIWWLLVWRGVFGGALLGAAVGAVVGFIAGIVAYTVFHVPANNVVYASIGRTSALIVTAPLGIWYGLILIKWAVKKKYSDFRIVLIARENAP